MEECHEVTTHAILAAADRMGSITPERHDGTMVKRRWHHADHTALLQGTPAYHVGLWEGEGMTSSDGTRPHNAGAHWKCTYIWIVAIKI